MVPVRKKVLKYGTPKPRLRTRHRAIGNQLASRAAMLLGRSGSGIRRPTMADQCECRVRRQNLFKRTRKAKILNPGLQAKGRGHSVLLPHLQDESGRARLQEASGVLFSWNKASRSIIV